MDDLEELLKDLQEHPLTKENENDARNDFNLSDFESILVNPEGKGSLPRPLRAAYQATTNGSGIPNNTSLGRIVGSLRNSHDPPRLAETTAATEKQGISKTISSTSESTRTASGKPLKLCAICDQGIQKGGSALNGRFYHSEHFTCNVCNTNLKGALVFEKDHLLWCETDYHIKYSPECFYCKERITDGNEIEALGKTFHQDHFFCAQCGESLVNKKFREFQGKAFCSEDYATLFASRCAHCFQPLLEDHISALSKNYHKDHFICSAKNCGKVLGINGFYDFEEMPYCEYHFYQLSDNICVACDGIILGRCVVAFGKKFHTAHFKCTFCTKELDGTEGGYKGKGGKAYCSACYIKIFS